MMPIPAMEAFRQCLGSASSGYSIKYVKEWVQYWCLLWSDHILQSQMPNCLALSLPRVFLSVPHTLLGLCILLEPWQFLAWYTVISQGFSSFCNISIHNQASLCVSFHCWMLNQLAFSFIINSLYTIIKYKIVVKKDKRIQDNFASLPDHAKLRWDHPDKLVPEEARQHVSLSLFPGL